LSVGILEPQIHPTLLNTVEFLWDPSRRTSVFVQVGARPERGGEGGSLPHPDRHLRAGTRGPPEHLHSASCLVKVFKVPGRGGGKPRKQKTDREKVEKQPAAEREKFQPAYESTVLAEVGLLKRGVKILISSHVGAACKFPHYPWGGTGPSRCPLSLKTSSPVPAWWLPTPSINGNWQNSHPRKCPRPGWMGLGAAWGTGRSLVGLSQPKAPKDSII
uniref:Grh/CP2 DB domain-containing protein n=1 Tax=Serinus canaria TaxID=9135 RepID=A0A8C9MYB5_SERCA